MGYCSTLVRKMGYKVVRCDRSDKDLIEMLKRIYIHIKYLKKGVKSIPWLRTFLFNLDFV